MCRFWRTMYMKFIFILVSLLDCEVFGRQDWDIIGK